MEGRAAIIGGAPQLGGMLCCFSSKAAIVQGGDGWLACNEGLDFVPKDREVLCEFVAVSAGPITMLHATVHASQNAACQCAFASG